MTQRAPLYITVLSLALASSARAQCNPKCEKEETDHVTHASKCVAITPPPSGCGGAAESGELEPYTGEQKVARSGNGGNPVVLRQGANGLATSAASNLHNATGKHPGNHLATVSGTAGGGDDMTAADVLNYEKSVPLIREEFDAYRKKLQGEGAGDWLIRRSHDIESELLKRLKANGTGEFPRHELTQVAEMLEDQRRFGRELRRVLEDSNLPREEKRRIINDLKQLSNVDAILRDPALSDAVRAQLKAKVEEISASMGAHHDPNRSGVLTELHNAISDVMSKNRPKPGEGGGDIYIPNPPGSHGSYMQDKYPKDPATWESAARDKLFKGDVTGGLADLNKAIDLGAGADAHLLRGGILLEKGDFAGALADARAALAKRPGDQNALFILQAASGRGAGSTSSGSLGAQAGGDGGFSGGSGYGSQTGGGQFLTGMTDRATLASMAALSDANRALAMGDLQTALMHAQKALQLNPNNAQAHNLISLIYARMKDYKNALAAANAGLAVSGYSANSELLNRKAFAENRLKQWRDALASSNAAIQAGPRDARAYANRAHAYGGLGDRSSMLDDINRAASLDPSFKDAADKAALLQLPSADDILFLFPGEDGGADASAAAGASAGRGRRFGVVVGAGLLGGLLVALGLLSTVLAPLKDAAVSAFTKVSRRGPAVGAIEREEEATPAPASAAAPLAGLIRGQYEIIRQIGAGGMGMVFEGVDKSLNRRVAIKKMREELRSTSRDRFIIEAKTVASLHHPNIVDIYAIAEHGDDIYLVFEYVDGKTVHELVEAAGRLAPSEAVRLTSAIAEALAYAHGRGVIHRDMKPSNVMIAGGRVKVMDFGIARMAKDALTRYSMTNTVVGTPPYMAPEQEQGQVRKESDVYALAVCSYEMLTGKLPFIGMGAGMLMNKINMSYVAPSRAIAGLPETLDDVFHKAFQADPDQRYRTPQEFAAALEAAAGGARAKV